MKLIIACAVRHAIRDGSVWREPTVEEAAWLTSMVAAAAADVEVSHGLCPDCMRLCRAGYVFNHTSYTWNEPTNEPTVGAA